MSWMYLLIALLVAAAIISFVLSLVGVLFVGMLKLIPIVFIILVIAVLLGKVKITIVRDQDDEHRHWLD